MTLSPVTTDQAPQPLGHYQQGIRAAGLVHVSGQLPIRPGEAPGCVPRAFPEQATLVVQNFLAIVAAAGGRREDVVKVTAYIVGVENWPAFNTAFSALFGEHRPARSVVPVPELHHGYLIELDGVAIDKSAPPRR
ncbi:RidA family protein [Bosea sp. (in: a-proteobacteria)]|uniref:RidA family protein n=1 Tax=Bosea sp. (in: a-proteobacteria) TaxID=1871050 RepID=UPI00261F2D85|nr:RidA family protein [Bosea sp. (in: a-proteobacteria)]MCO5092582.1 RidA family protein [Bosea sp. (in: a-proteobacteria)]